MNLCQRVWIIALVMSSLLMTIRVTPVMSADPKDDLRPRMQSIFQALTIVFPFSMTDEAFESAANRQPILDGLRTIAGNATKLTSHGKSVPPSFDFLQQSLSQDAQATLARFEAGYHEEARFGFRQLIDNCFLCHSQLPKAKPFKLGKHFLEQLKMAELSPFQQVQIAVATRQFDTALSTCEAVFQSLTTAPAQIDLTGLFEDYLRLVIRVNHDFPRATKTLEAFQRRPDIPPYLRTHITTWVTTLKSLQQNPIQKDVRSHAQALIEQGQQRNRFLADRRGLIHFVAASSLLHRYVSNGPKSPVQLAEAYYLLGVADSYIPRSSWISETEYFLERAIRLAPKSEIAKTAYSFLEESVLTRWVDLGDVDVPSTPHPLLRELRQLIEGS